MKLWQKNIASTKEVETFTVGKDRELDLYLAPFDVLGSLAHIQMLQTINLLTPDELAVLQKGLKEIYKDIESGKFTFVTGSLCLMAGIVSRYATSACTSSSLI